MKSISQKLKLLESIFGKSIFSGTTNEAMFYCPSCRHHKRKLSINLETDKYHCWVCSLAGTKLYFLIKKYSSPEKAREYNANFGNVKFQSKQEKAFKITLPDEYSALHNANDSALGKRAWNYLTRERKIKEIDILRYKIGLNLQEKHYGSILFPSFDKYGEINYYISRHFDKHIKYYGAEVPKDYKNQIIMNELNIDWQKPITIVEGFIDAIKTGENNVIPLCGSYFSKSTKLLDKITENKTTTYLALDPDAKEKTLKIAKNLTQREIDVYVVDMGEYEDVGSMEYGVFAQHKERAQFVCEDFLFRENMKRMIG
jgi:hypothetical protein